MYSESDLNIVFCNIPAHAVAYEPRLPAHVQDARLAARAGLRARHHQELALDIVQWIR